jgi:hypothetical protein
MRNTLAHFNHNARAFVAHDEGSRMGPFTLLKVQIAVAHTRASDFHLDFSGAGRREINIENFDRLIG